MLACFSIPILFSLDNKRRRYSCWHISFHIFEKKHVTDVETCLITKIVYFWLFYVYIFLYYNKFQSVFNKFWVMSSYLTLCSIHFRGNFNATSGETQSTNFFKQTMPKHHKLLFDDAASSWDKVSSSRGILTRGDK